MHAGRTCRRGDTALVQPFCQCRTSPNRQNRLCEKWTKGPFIAWHPHSVHKLATGSTPQEVAMLDLVARQSVPLSPRL
jgi:hypothetical protein